MRTIWVVGKIAVTKVLTMVMKRIGITNPDEYEKFITELSSSYLEAGQDPAGLFEDINQLHYFLEKNKGPHGRNSLPQIEAIIEGKKAEGT